MSILRSVWQLVTRHRRLRLRTILLYINLFILVLPITGFWGIRIYENELARRTESALLSQGAFIRAAFLDELSRIEQRPQSEFLSDGEEQLEYIPSTIDLNSKEVLEKAPAAQPTTLTATPTMMLAGERVSRQMHHAQRTTLAGMRVVDHQGVVVASSRGEIGMSMIERPEIQSALEGTYTHTLRSRVSDSPTPPLTSISRRTSVRLFVAMPIERDGEVIGAVLLSRTPLSLARALYDNRKLLVILGVLQLIVVLLLSTFASRAIVGPMQRLIRQAKELERGAPTPPVLEHPITQEVEELSKAIVQMADALHERSDYIKTFASSVSHEFKTPLTAIRGTVELLSDHLDSMTLEERRKFLGIIDDNAHRLQRLVHKLMELARAEVHEPGAQRCTPVEVVEEVRERFVTEGLQIRIIASKGAFDQQVCVAPLTLSTALNNLIENARQHVGEEVEIEIEARERDTHLEVLVRDNGPGISKGNRARIFEPFFTTARDSGGTGLGLATIKSLIQSHHGDVTLQEGLPTTFVITLLRAPQPPSSSSQ